MNGPREEPGGSAKVRVDGGIDCGGDGEGVQDRRRRRSGGRCSAPWREVGRAPSRWISWAEVGHVLVELLEGDARLQEAIGRSSFSYGVMTVPGGTSGGGAWSPRPRRRRGRPESRGRRLRGQTLRDVAAPATCERRCREERRGRDFTTCSLFSRTPSGRPGRGRGTADDRAREPCSAVIRGAWNCDGCRLLSSRSPPVSTRTRSTIAPRVARRGPGMYARDPAGCRCGRSKSPPGASSCRRLVLAPQDPLESLAEGLVHLGQQHRVGLCRPSRTARTHAARSAGSWASE